MEYVWAKFQCAELSRTPAGLADVSFFINFHYIK